MNKYEPDSFDRFVIAIKDIVVECKDFSPSFIAYEIRNRMNCYYMSDRESDVDNTVPSGVKDNLVMINNVLRIL
jgi:hypothetical protein